MGIYSKNCPEWVLTDLATATLGGTVVPIHETFGQNAVELIINETQLSTITTLSCNLKSLIFLKNTGKADSLKFLVSIDEFDNEVETEAKEAGITLFTINEVVEKGKKFKKEDLDSSLPSSDSIYTLSYTSGTTDDPKAVILTHGNFVSASSSIF